MQQHRRLYSGVLIWLSAVALCGSIQPVTGASSTKPNCDTIHCRGTKCDVRDVPPRTGDRRTQC